MKIQLIFSTNSGGTQSAATTVAETLTKLGHSVDLKETLEVDLEQLGTHDLTILASPSWDYNGLEGQPHEHFIEFLPKAEKKLQGKKLAIFGLGDSSYTVYGGAVDELEKFAKKIGAILVTPSLKIDGYFYHTQEATEALTHWAETLVYN